MKSRIQKLADSQKRSPQRLMVDAIREYVETEEQRGQLRHMLQAWDEYQESGRRVTGEEVIAWLKTWGQHGEQDAPACHKQS